MKKSSFTVAILLPVLLLAGCTSTASNWPTQEDYLANPLFADQYWAEVTERMVILLENPLIKADEEQRKVIDDLRQHALLRRADAGAKRKQGLFGHFSTILEDTDGYALLLKNTVYLSPLFRTNPGVELRIYATGVVDPRDTNFPDETSVDLGVLRSPYGAQQYTLPAYDEQIHLRTIVLWDAKLKRVHAFAQLSPDISAQVKDAQGGE